MSVNVPTRRLPTAQPSPMREWGSLQHSLMKRSGFKTKQSELKRTRIVRRRRTALRAKPDPKMAAWSKEVLERDGHHCRWPECSEHGEHVRGHHINEKSQRPDLKYNVDNGVAMCPVHHDRLHHTVAGRTEAKRLGLLGGETYEKALRAA